MKYITPLILAGAFLAATPLVYAEDNSGSRQGPPPFMGMSGEGWVRDGQRGLDDASSTEHGRPPMGELRPNIASTTRGMLKDRDMSERWMIPGIVTEVSANSFLLGTRREGATTTLTVNVSDTTVFRLGSTTVSLSALTVGAHVQVRGALSTTTMSIAAADVMIDSGKMVPLGKKEGLFTRLFNFFGGKHDGQVRGEATTTEDGTGVQVKAGLFARIGGFFSGWFGRGDH